MISWPLVQQTLFFATSDLSCGMGDLSLWRGASPVLARGLGSAGSEALLRGLSCPATMRT